MTRHRCRPRARGRSLHRRIFLWFGVTIVLTAVVTLATVAAVSGRTEPWARATERMEHFVAARFGAVWADADARVELARSLSNDLGVGLELVDAATGARASYGPTCRHHSIDATVRDARGAAVGTVRACWAPPTGSRWGPPLALLVAALTLWAASGLLARRIVRPLRELTAVTRDIGAGQLGRRAALARDESGEVGTLAESVNEMAVRIEQQLADQRELLAAVSHEVRTPLGHLRVLAELLRSKGADEKLVAEIEREVHDVDDLMGRLLASSRLDFTAVDRRRLDPAEVARRALERAELEPELLVVEGTAGEIEGDPTLLARALANLLENARSHGGGVERLRVSREPSTERVAFAVEDRGPGFTEEALSRAFDSFYRSPPGPAEPPDGEAPTEGSRRGAKGARASLGLGLALVQRIAVAHGGDAWAENRDDGGARVGFRVAGRGKQAPLGE